MSALRIRKPDLRNGVAAKLMLLTGQVGLRFATFSLLRVPALLDHPAAQDSRS